VTHVVIHIAPCENKKHQQEEGQKYRQRVPVGDAGPYQVADHRKRFFPLLSV
jgi:hypothetical protein